MRFRRDGRVKPGHDKMKSFAGSTRESITLALATSLIAAGLLGVYLALTGFTDYSPGNSTIQGVGFCAGSPTTGDLLTYGGASWCGSTTLAANYNIGAGTGQYNPALVLAMNGNNEYEIGTADNEDISFDNSGDFKIYTTSRSILNLEVLANGNLIPRGAIEWNNGADLTETNAPRSTFGGFLSSFSVGALTDFAEYEPSAAITVRGISYALVTAPAGCTTYPTLQAYSGSAALTGTTVTLQSGVYNAALTGISDIVAVSTPIFLQMGVAPAGCTTNPAGVNVTVEYTTN